MSKQSTSFEIGFASAVLCVSSAERSVALRS